MRKLRVLVLVREGRIPPPSLDGLSEQEALDWKPEFDVVSALRDLNHEVHPVEVWDDLTPLRAAILEQRPHITFMLLEEFHGVATYDQHVVSYLELMQQPYTGCNPRGLLLTHDKALSKKILSYHRISTPKFVVFPLGRVVRPPRKLSYPLFVKSVTEDASLGIAQASIVTDDEMLLDRVKFVHENVHTDALAEEYIDGRELYVGLMGNQRLQSFPIWEMRFTKSPKSMPRIATAKAKWDVKYQMKHGIKTHAAQDLPEEQSAKIHRLCKRVYRALNISGYARMDLRLAPDGRVYVIEANANPNIGYGEDFADSAETVGIGYEGLLQRIMGLGLRYQAPWKA